LLDSTSISCWSELIDDVEWGYNRDGDTLAYINLCMPMGQQSRLPVRATARLQPSRDGETGVAGMNEECSVKLQFIKRAMYRLAHSRGFRVLELFCVCLAFRLNAPELSSEVCIP